MNIPNGKVRTANGFTLIELLVVIAIIGILAGLLLAVGQPVMRKAALARARAELMKVDLAINGYKTKLGLYPPDNPADPARNLLYYELLGGSTNMIGGVGIVNASSGASSDDAIVAQAFLREVKPGQFGEVGGIRRLGVNVDGPVMYGNISPFYYIATNPTNNVNSFDLWVDVRLGGKNYRVSNWSPQPQTVP